MFAIDKVHFWGQPLFAVIAETRDQARRAAHAAVIEYRDLAFITSVRDAQAAGGRVESALFDDGEQRRQVVAVVPHSQQC